MSPEPALSKLPPELLLHIASFLRPQLEEAKTAGVPRLALGKLQKSRAALFNYANTCRRFKDVLDAHVYHTVVIEQPRSQESNEAMDFLDILNRRPVVRGWVKELLLVLYSGTNCYTILSGSQTSLLARLADEARIQLLDERKMLQPASRLLFDKRTYASGTCYYNEVRLAVLASVLIRILPGIRNLSLSSSVYIMNKMDFILHSPNPRPEDKWWPEATAPTSFAVCDDPRTRGPFDVAQVGLFCLRGMGQGASHLSIQGLDIVLPPLNKLPDLEFTTTTSLCLKDLCMDLSKLRDLLLLFPYLETFKYFYSRDSFSATATNPITPLDALRRSHPRQGLRTLCIDVTLLFPTTKECAYDTFQDFRGLENLWISSSDIYSTHQPVSDGTPAAPGEETLLQTLPSSLKRLHVAGHQEAVCHDMWWLAQNCRDQGLHRLEEVAYGNAGPMEWGKRPSAADEAFARIGVRSSRDVGNPALW